MAYISNGHFMYFTYNSVNIRPNYIKVVPSESVFEGLSNGICNIQTLK